mgnify:CR=1 FL=1
MSYQTELLMSYQTEKSPKGDLNFFPKSAKKTLKCWNDTLIAIGPNVYIFGAISPLCIQYTNVPYVYKKFQTFVFT